MAHYGQSGWRNRICHQPQKTSEASLEETTALHAIDNVLEYTADDLKTEKRMYVSGVNCQIPYAKEQFIETKRRFGKMDGRTCYHGYQSFRAGEVDADTAHRIGVALAKELWGDQFEVVVATHLNTDHYRLTNDHEKCSSEDQYGLSNVLGYDPEHDRSYVRCSTVGNHRQQEPSRGN